MGKEQRKLQKKKEREKIVQAKLRGKREATRKKAKEERQEILQDKQFKKVVNQRMLLEQWAKKVGDKIPEETRNQIMHNIEILKSLEEEHAEEVSKKQGLQEKLKEEGHESLNEMMGAMQEKAKKESIQRELEATADIDYAETLPLQMVTQEDIERLRMDPAGVVVDSLEDASRFVQKKNQDAGSRLLS